MNTTLLAVYLLFILNLDTALSNNKEQENYGKVVNMNNALFISDVFDYENSTKWKYKGNKPAIIDLYADWCGPCRMMTPVMNKLAKEYADDIIIYKVNVDKEQKLAALFQATSIPLFVFIPMEGEPQLMKGVADKSAFKTAIDSFLLNRTDTQSQ